jgi:hypothetical protein
MNPDGSLNKEKFTSHLKESKNMAVEVMGIPFNDFQISMRLWPFMWNDQDFSKLNPEISPYLLVNGKYDLTQFNEQYFKNISEMVHIACSLGIFLYIILFDNCHGNLPNSPWICNINGVNGFYDDSSIAVEMKKLWIYKMLNAAIYYNQTIITVPQKLCPIDNTPCDGRYKTIQPGEEKLEQICGVQVCNEPDDHRFKDLGIQVMSILQEPRYQKLITQFRTIFGARALRPGSQEEQQLFRDSSYGLFLAGLRGPGVSGKMLFKSFHNFGEIYNYSYLINTLDRAELSDGCFISVDGDYPKLPEIELQKKIEHFLNYRSPQHNRAYKGRYFAFESLVDDEKDWTSFKGMLRGIKNHIDCSFK